MGGADAAGTGSVRLVSLGAELLGGGDEGGVDAPSTRDDITDLAEHEVLRVGESVSQTGRDPRGIRPHSYSPPDAERFDSFDTFDYGIQRNRGAVVPPA